MELKLSMDGSVGEIVGAWVEKLNPALARECMRLANIAGGEIANYAMTYFPNGTGELARSFLPAKFVQSSEGIAAGALSDLDRARILNDGGTITPKTVSKLAIPLTKQAEKLWPRDWPRKDLTLIVGNGKAVLCSKQGDRLKAQYALVSSVTIRGRHYIDHAAAATKLESEGESAHRLVEDAFDAAGGD